MDAELKAELAEIKSMLNQILNPPSLSRSLEIKRLAKENREKALRKRAGKNL
jgi:hypothetical protein